MSILTQASLVLTPNAVKASKLYSIIPSNGNGDMTVVRATSATRVNSLGLIESVSSNVPRLNYDGSCPSILVEPQRTNLVPYSEMFADSSWIKTNSATVTANVDISPAGTLTADRLTAGATLSQIQNGTTAVVSGNIYTVSIWIKRISGTGQVYLRAIENINTPITITNDWVRYSVTVTATSTIGRIGVALQTSGDVVSIWGAQLELGAYLTSYIPTITATTRNADVITRNNIYTNNLITSAGGTWFIELNNNFILTRTIASGGLSIADLSGNQFQIRAGSTANRLLILKTINNTNTSLYTTLTNTVKIAIDWNGATADIFVNGVKVVTGTIFTTLNMNSLSIDADDVPKYIKSMMLFPKPLTDSECIALTTL